MSFRHSLASVTALATLATGCAIGAEDAVAPTPEGTSDPAPSRSPRATAPSSPPSSPPSSSAAPETSPPAPRWPRVLETARDGVPGPARSPRELAGRIRVAEQTIADPGSPPAAVAAAGRVQQLAYRQLGVTPRWDARVRARMPAGLRRVVADNVASRREFRSLQGSTLSDTLPAWRIIRPEPPQRLLAHYREAERTFGVDWEYLAAINLVETGMGRIRGFSVAGARGPMQFIPETWARYGRGDIDDPRDAILAAGRYLSARGFARGPRGRADALYSYNNSGAYVRGVTLLAEVMRRSPRAFLGYYHWEIYYLSTAGDVLLPVGYLQREPIPVRRWLAQQDSRDG